MRSTFIGALAATAALSAAPALAQQQGGHSGGHGQTTSQPTSTTGTTVRDQSRTNSQGPANASSTGIANANENSALATGTVAGSTLPGLTTGQTVQGSGGTTLGTVSRVITGRDGSIRSVEVTSATGQTYRLQANTLSISGGVVTTTSTNLGQ